MFRWRYSTGPIRVLIWLISICAYWGLIFAAGLATRLRVFYGYEIFLELSARHKLPDILSRSEELTGRAWQAINAAGPVPGIFMAVPVVMGIILFVTPFFVRRDYRRPIRSVIMLPVMTALCYIFSMLMVIVAAAGVQLAIHWHLGTKPGPDFFTMLVHPLYLFTPNLMPSTAGFASQIVYIIFIVSVLTMRGKKRASTVDEAGDSKNGRDDKNGEKSGGPDDWRSIFSGDSISACEMETDRLCRLMEARIGRADLIEEVRGDVRNALAEPGKIEREVTNGAEPYHIVLFETAKSLRRIVQADPAAPGACDAFEYIVTEIERMGYCSADDVVIMRGWVASRRRAAQAHAQAAPSAVSAPPPPQPVLGAKDHLTPME